MKVILKKHIAKLGHEWDVVTVKNGYARNYLLPNNLADIASPALIKKAEAQAGERIKKMKELMTDSKNLAEKLAGITLSFKKKAKDGKLYGSITEKDIIDALKKNHKVDLDKGVIKMDEHLKTVGEHKINLHLIEGIDVSMTIKIETQ